jgi:type IV pilus assembly protein PilN
MIKINLLGDSTYIDRSAKIELFAYALAIALTFLVCFGLYTAVLSTRSSLTIEVAELTKELEAIKMQTKEVSDLEKKRTELFGKLEVIASLRRSKKGPVRVLDDLNSTLPLRSWITEIVEKQNSAVIMGVALDNQTIATFMQDLEKSDYYDNVELEETKQGERDGIGVKTFAIRSKVSYSGTTPILEGSPSDSTQKVAKAQ